MTAARCTLLPGNLLAIEFPPGISDEQLIAELHELVPQIRPEITVEELADLADRALAGEQPCYPPGE